MSPGSHASYRLLVLYYGYSEYMLGRMKHLKNNVNHI